MKYSLVAFIKLIYSLFM